MKAGNDVQDENMKTRLFSRKDMAKPQQFYWDLYQGAAKPSTESTVRGKYQVMSHGKAKSVLGLWTKGSLAERKRNEQEDITEEGILEAFRKKSKMLEDVGRNCKEYTLQDIHEAYQVLLKSARLKKLGMKEDFNITTSHRR